MPAHRFSCVLAVLAQWTVTASPTVQPLAERSGISHRYLSHLETGSRRRMSPTRYVALRTALHATDEEL
ncbi:helix-turn-helix transcriptional regulator, partial [Streptomyces sp. A73]|nr:helix-turn-helix transcriptional regulator [Streptomyces sp. A73]